MLCVKAASSATLTYLLQHTACKFNYTTVNISCKKCVKLEPMHTMEWHILYARKFRLFKRLEPEKNETFLRTFELLIAMEMSYLSYV